MKFVLVVLLFCVGVHGIPIPGLYAEPPVFLWADAFTVRFPNITQVFALSSETKATLSSVRVQMFIGDGIFSVLQCFNNNSAISSFSSISTSFQFNATGEDVVIRFDDVKPADSRTYASYLIRFWFTFTSGNVHGPNPCSTSFSFPPEIYSLEVRGLSTIIPRVVMCADEDIEAGKCSLDPVQWFLNGTAARVFGGEFVILRGFNASQSELYDATAYLSSSKSTQPADRLSANGTTGGIFLNRRNTAYFALCHTRVPIHGTSNYCSTLLPVIAPQYINVTDGEFSDFVQSGNASMLAFYGAANDSVVFPPSFATAKNDGKPMDESMRVVSRISQEFNSTVANASFNVSDPSLRVLASRSIYLNFSFPDPVVRVPDRLPISYRVSFSAASLVSASLGASYVTKVGNYCSIASLPANHTLQWIFTNGSGISVQNVLMSVETYLHNVDGCLYSIFIPFPYAGTFSLVLVRRISFAPNVGPNSGDSSSSSDDTAIIAGSTVGAVAAVSCIGGVATFFYIRKRRLRVKQSRAMLSENIPLVDIPPTLNPLSVLYSPPPSALPLVRQQRSTPYS
eukprot:ANDGO_04923.mRNA.1 hypothetical protein